MIVFKIFTMLEHSHSHIYLSMCPSMPSNQQASPVLALDILTSSRSHSLHSLDSSLILVFCFLCLAFAYFLIGLSPDRFGGSILVSILCYLVGTALAFLCASSSRNYTSAFMIGTFMYVLLFPPFSPPVSIRSQFLFCGDLLGTVRVFFFFRSVTIWNLVGGFYLLLPSVNIVLRWLQWTSPLYYGYAGLMYFQVPIPTHNVTATPSRS